MAPDRAITFRANGFRVVVFYVPVTILSLAIVFGFFHFTGTLDLSGSAAAEVPGYLICVGVVMTVASCAGVLLSNYRHFDVVLTDTHLEGPTPSPSGPERLRVPVGSVDIAHSHRPWLLG